MKEWLEGEDLSEELKRENPFLRQEVNLNPFAMLGGGEGCDPSFHGCPPGSGLVGGEAAHSEGGAGGSDAVRPSAVRLPGGQEWRREEEGSGCRPHLHDAPGIRQDEQGRREAQSTAGAPGRLGLPAAGAGADCCFPVCSRPPRTRWSPCWRRPERPCRRSLLLPPKPQGAKAPRSPTGPHRVRMALEPRRLGWFYFLRGRSSKACACPSASRCPSAAEDTDAKPDAKKVRGGGAAGAGPRKVSRRVLTELRPCHHSLVPCTNWVLAGQVSTRCGFSAHPASVLSRGTCPSLSLQGQGH